MDKFYTYFEDKKFVEWALNPNESLNHYWSNYLKAHPNEKNQLELAHYLMTRFKSKREEQVSSEEALTLLADIFHKLETKQRHIRHKKMAMALMRYAAVGIIFFIMGVAYFYHQNHNEFTNYARELSSEQSGDVAHLILGDGKNIPIKEKESSIEYREDGKIIINRQDTMITTADDENQQMNHLVVPYGKSSSIRLSDGTIAYLNSGSRLIYPGFFERKKREVFLIGEGFFDVVPDPDKPFIVQTNDLSIEVLGTRFNLSAYPSDQVVEAVLVEGKIKLKPKGLNTFFKESLLEPGQLALYNRTNTEVKINTVDVINYTSWHKGYLNFESSDLSRIVKKLERYYNIKIILNDPMLGIRSISGKLQLKEDKEHALKVLATTASAELKKLNDHTYVLK